MSSLSTAGRALPGARRRSLWGLVAAAATMVGVIAIPAQPAAAGGAYELLSSSAWAHTDSREPDTLVRNGDGDAPVGSWRDAEGKHHKSRSYFTFDLTRFHGTRILGGYGFFGETRAENCDAERAIEVWLADPVTGSSNWREPPTEQERLYRIGPGNVRCPAPYLEFTVAEALREAVNAKQDTLTLVVRAPEELEGDPNVGRWLRNQLHISVNYNTPPGTPTDLEMFPGGACLGEVPGSYINTTTPRLKARFSDPEPGLISAVFAIWPAAHPDQRTEITATSISTRGLDWIDVPQGSITGDGTYGWAVRAQDDYDASGWSEACYFTLDTTKPEKAPMIVPPAEYPENEWSGGPGISGTFTFSANGEADVAGYLYGSIYEPYKYVAANELGGSATVSYVPRSSGRDTFAVMSVDRAGNRSPETRYTLLVNENRPYLTTDAYPIEPGVPFDATFHPRMENVVSYTYKIEYGPEQTVAAGEDGTATVELSFEEPGLYTIYIRSTDASGYTTLYDDHSIYVEEPWDDGGWDW